MTVDERSLRVQQWFEWPMVVAALLVIPAIVFEESSLGEPWKTVGEILNWGTWSAAPSAAAPAGTSHASAKESVIRRY